MYRLFKIITVGLLASVSLWGQGEMDVVTFDIKIDRDTVRPGEQVTVSAHISIIDGWHIYSSDLKGMGPVPSHFEFTDDKIIQAMDHLVEPASKRVWDEGFQIEVGWHSNDLIMSQTVQIAEGLEPGTYPLAGEFKYMACTEVMCLPPAAVAFEFPIEVEAGEIREAFAFVTPQTPKASLSEFTERDLHNAIKSGLFSFLLLSIGMGFLALLTPCVFPMIPITVSFFLKQGESGEMPPVKSAGLYALGIIVIYSALGLILALTLGASGANQIASNPWVNLLLAALFVYFALSLFGMYEIQLPSKLRQFSVQQETRGGTIGILFMSLTFTLTSFTCTVQFVGLLLVAASQGHYLWPLIGMVTYSTAFALPFFLLALFPQKLAQLPKSGGWLNSVKVVMGFLEIAAAFKFISNTDLVWGWHFFDHQLVLATWTIIVVMTGFYILGKLQLPHDSLLERITVPRLLTSGAFLIFGVILAGGLVGQKLPGLVEAYLPPRVAEDSGGIILGGELESLQWYEEFVDARAQSKLTNTPIFIDVTGYTCTNCRWMEANIFTKPIIASRLKKFVLLRLYTDGGENYKAKQQFAIDRFGSSALPLYSIIAPDGTELARFPGMTRDPDKFARFLDQGIDYSAAAEDEDSIILGRRN